jgi:hypothetical protein
MRHSFPSFTAGIALIAATCAMLAACAPVQLPPVVTAQPVPANVPPPPPPPPAKPEPADAAARRLLAYNDQMRQWQPPELTAEVNRLNNVLATQGAATSPADILELALVLSQTRNNGDLGRAMALVDPITRSSAKEVQPWQGLARLLAVRFAEQRRLEDAVERQKNELRDAQRNAQQLNEKLEALKAIERSINARPQPTPPAPPPASAPKAP